MCSLYPHPLCIVIVCAGTDPMSSSSMSGPGHAVSVWYAVCGSHGDRQVLALYLSNDTLLLRCVEQRMSHHGLWLNPLLLLHCSVTFCHDSSPVTPKLAFLIPCSFWRSVGSQKASSQPAHPSFGRCSCQGVEIKWW